MPINPHAVVQEELSYMMETEIDNYFVEIGNTESVNSLRDNNLVAGYFFPRTIIQIYLAVKLFSLHQDVFETAPHLKLSSKILYMYVPANTITGVRFGCSSSVLHGIPNNFNIDLWNLQDAILSG
ncbi:8985_t:CDS:2 [Entrophospora sp. SA101]|nr:8985_t:CDS:2 [Entrophospora sp. SA101]CAJ0837962.1 10584_t:CDS:2 [Entrophospora sp. SA101]